MLFSEDADGVSRRSFQDPLSEQRDPLTESLYQRDVSVANASSVRGRISSVGSQGSETLSRGQRSRQGSAGRRTPLSHTEMDMALDNQGYDYNEASDSSSTWSPEVLERTVCVNIDGWVQTSGRIFAKISINSIYLTVSFC